MGAFFCTIFLKYGDVVKKRCFIRFKKAVRQYNPAVFSENIIKVLSYDFDICLLRVPARLNIFAICAVVSNRTAKLYYHPFRKDNHAI